MLLLNFSHPITEKQKSQLEALLGKQIERIIDIKVHFNQDQPFMPQLQETMKDIPLTSTEWQTTPLLVNLPSYNYIAAMIIAELNGRMGHFPAILRLKPVSDSLPPEFEVAEVINLQAIRNQAREIREQGDN